MNTLVVYYSKYGNTKLVAESIARTLLALGAARTLPLEQLSMDDLSDVDLLIMGSPTHVMNLPKAVKPLLKSLTKGCLKGIHTAAFDTSYKMSRWLEPFTAAKRLKSNLKSAGGKMVAKPETFHVMESEGPLYDGEIERALTWAAELTRKVDAYRAGG